MHWKKASFLNGLHITGINKLGNCFMLRNILHLVYYPDFSMAKDRVFPLLVADIFLS